MKFLFKIQSIFMLVLLCATSMTFAQTPDQVYIPKLGTPQTAFTNIVYGFQYTPLANGGYATAGLTNFFTEITVQVHNQSGTVTNSQTIATDNQAHTNLSTLSDEYIQLVTLKDGSFLLGYFDNYSFMIQKFTAAGALSGAALSVFTLPGTGTSGRSGFFRILPLDNGGFATLTTYQLTSGKGMAVKQYNASLTQVGTTYTSDLTILNQPNYNNILSYHARLFKLTNDNYVVTVAEQGAITPPNVSAAVFQFDTNNNLVGTVKTFNAKNLTLTGVGLTGGGYVIVYHTLVSGVTKMLFQLYDATGMAVGTPQTVSDPASGYSIALDGYKGDVLARPDGGFNLTQRAASSSTSDLFIRAYSSTGTELASANKFQLLTEPTLFTLGEYPHAGLALPTGGYVYGATKTINTTTGSYEAYAYQLDANLNLVGTPTRITIGYNGEYVTPHKLFNYGNGFAIRLRAYSSPNIAFSVQRFGATSCLTAPTLSGTTAANTCPTTTANLSSLVTSTAPSGSTIKWFNNATASGTAIADPTAVATAGTYYAYYYNATDNCYTPASVGVTVTITACTPPLTASDPTAQTATTNQAKTGNAATELAPTGGTSPYTYSNGSGDAACVAPSGATALTGLTVNPDGTYSYTAPATAGTYYYCIKVCDSATPTASCVVKTYTLTVTAGASCTVTGIVPTFIKN